jgi:hypothetical protein
MRIRAISILTTGLVLGTTAVSLATAYLAQQSFDARHQAFVQRADSLVAISMLARGSDNLTHAVRAYAATGDPAYRTAFDTELRVTRLRERAGQRLRELEATAEEFALIEQAKATSDALVTLENKAFAAAEAGDFAQAIRHVYGFEYRVTKENIMALIDEARLSIETRLDAETAALSERAEWLGQLSRISAIVNALILFGVLIVFFHQRVVLRIARLSRDTRAMLGGEQDIRFPYQEIDDEVGDLARSLDAFRQANAEIEAQNWIRQGRAEIGAELQHAASHAELAQTLFSRLAPLIGLGLASLYRMERADHRLRLAGAYAHSGTIQPPEAYALGEALPGQCALDARAIRIEQAPPDYPRIRTGLGEITPASIVLYPIPGPDGVLGVIEMATLASMNAAQSTLVDGLLPLIAMRMQILEREAPGTLAAGVSEEDKA